ncbi:MAG: DUF1700 domain-containing protein [Lentilactobacillus diolivorans]|jgi:uncharacterized membrane protein|nr:DUF1700 domain-containing protein [Lentilactobacillus diolivorans]RRG03303.1 MAG: DUF1700 domain-containing protein [Lactobacillus sp.]
MNDYIKQLTALLGQLSDEERGEVVDFYSEYLQDGGFVRFSDCVAELGTPRQLARKVLADYSIKTLENPSRSDSRTQRSKSDVQTIWIIVLALLSTPVTIPLAVGVAAMFVVAIAVTFALIVSVIAIFVSIIAGGLGSFILGISMLFSHFWVGLFYFGIGLAVVGALLMLTPIFKWAIDGLIHGITLFSKWIYSKISSKNRAQRKDDQK